MQQRKQQQNNYNYLYTVVCMNEDNHPITPTKGGGNRYSSQKQTWMKGQGVRGDVVWPK